MRINCLTIVEFVLGSCSLLVKFFLNPIITFIWVTSPDILLWEEKHAFFAGTGWDWVGLEDIYGYLLSDAVVALEVCCEGFGFSWGFGVGLFLEERCPDITYSVILGCFWYLWNFLLNNFFNTANFIFYFFGFFTIIYYFLLDYQVSLFNLIQLIFLKNLRMISLLHPTMTFITIHPSFTSRIL